MPALRRIALVSTWKPCVASCERSVRRLAALSSTTSRRQMPAFIGGVDDRRFLTGA